MAEEGKVRIDKFDGKADCELEDADWGLSVPEEAARTFVRDQTREDESEWLAVASSAGRCGWHWRRMLPYNVMKEKTTYGLITALSNMYEKPSASNKALQDVNWLIRRWGKVLLTYDRKRSLDISSRKERGLVRALLTLSSIPDSEQVNPKPFLPNRSRAVTSLYWNPSPQSFSHRGLVKSSFARVKIKAALEDFNTWK